MLGVRKPHRREHGLITWTSLGLRFSRAGAAVAKRALASGVRVGSIHSGPGPGDPERRPRSLYRRVLHLRGTGPLVPPRKGARRVKLDPLARLEKDGPAPFYLVDGVRTLVEEFVQAVRTTVFPPGSAAVDFNLETLVGASSPLTRVLESARTLPAFAPRRLIIVRQAEALLKADDGDLLAYLERPSETTTLVLVAEDKWDRRTKLYKAVERAEGAVRFDEPSERELPKVLAARAKTLGISIRADAVRAIVAAVGPDLGGGLAALERLELFVGPGSKEPIRVEDVHAVIPSVRESSIFELVDAVASSDRAEVVRRIHQMVEVQREHPLRVLALIARQYRNLVRVRAALESGESERSLTGTLGLPPFVVNKLVEQARQGDASRFARSLASIATVDRANKGGVIDGARSVERLALALGRDERLDPPESRGG